MDTTKEIKIIWEYLVKDECIEQFIELYSYNGEWADLFRNYDGYIETELIRDNVNTLRFLTIDYWSSYLDYLEMKKKSIVKYNSLDKKCESYTSFEKEVGIFKSID